MMDGRSMLTESGARAIGQRQAKADAERLQSWTALDEIAIERDRAQGLRDAAWLAKIEQDGNPRHIRRNYVAYLIARFGQEWWDEHCNHEGGE